MEFKEYLLSLRKKKKLSTSKMADKLGVKESVIINLESGKKKPNLKFIKKLSKEFNIDITDIVPEEKLVSEIEKNKRYNLIGIIVLFVLSVIIFVMGYLFINSMRYNTISIYSFTGESDNFKFNNGLVVLSRDNKYIELSDFKLKNNLQLKSLTINVAFNESIWAIKEYDSTENLSISKWLKTVEFSEYDKEGFIFQNKDKSDSFSKYVTKFPYDFKVEVNYCTVDDCNVEILDIKTEKLNTNNKIKK